MLNKKIIPNNAIVDSLILLFMRQNEHSEAIEKIMDLFNQHGSKPTTTGILRLLDYFLANKNIYEAKRLVGVINQIYSRHEKYFLYGFYSSDINHNNHNNNNHNNNDDYDYKSDDNSNVNNKSSKNNANNDIDNILHNKLNTNINIMNLKKNKENKSFSFNNQNSNDGNFENNFIPSFGHSIKRDVPIGYQQRGVLSDELLEKRFNKYGLSQF
jgi:hypothetical protein